MATAELLATLRDDVALATRTGTPLQRVLAEPRVPRVLWTRMLRELLRDGIVLTREVRDEPQMDAQLAAEAATIEAEELMARHGERLVVAAPVAMRRRALGADRETYFQVSDAYLAILEHVGARRSEGVSQDEIGTLVGKRPKDLFMYIRNLDSGGLIVRENVQGKRSSLLFLPRFVQDVHEVFDIDGPSFSDLHSSKVPVTVFTQRLCAVLAQATSQTMRLGDMFEKLFQDQLEDRARNRKIFSAVLGRLQERGCVDRFIALNSDGRRFVCVQLLKPYVAEPDDLVVERPHAPAGSTVPMQVDVTVPLQVYNFLAERPGGATTRDIELLMGMDYRRVTRIIPELQKQNLIKYHWIEQDGRQRLYRYFAGGSGAPSAKNEASAEEPSAVRVVSEARSYPGESVAASAARSQEQPAMLKEEEEAEAISAQAQFFRAATKAGQARRQRILEMLREAGGLMVFAPIAVAKRLSDDAPGNGMVDRKTVSNLLDSMLAAGEVRKHVFRFEHRRTKSAMTTTIVTLPSVAMDDPRVRALEELEVQRTQDELRSSIVKRLPVKQPGEAFQDLLDSVGPSSRKLLRRSREEEIAALASQFPLAASSSATDGAFDVTSVFIASRSTRMSVLHGALFDFVKPRVDPSLVFDVGRALFSVPLPRFFELVAVQGPLPDELAALCATMPLPETPVCELPMPVQAFVAMQLAGDAANIAGMYNGLHHLGLIELDLASFPPTRPPPLNAAAYATETLIDFVTAYVPLPRTAKLFTSVFALDMLSEVLEWPVLYGNTALPPALTELKNRLPVRLQNAQIWDVTTAEKRMLLWAQLWASRSALMSLQPAKDARRYFETMQRRVTSTSIKIPASLLPRLPKFKDGADDADTDADVDAEAEVTAAPPVKRVRLLEPLKIRMLSETRMPAPGELQTVKDILDERRRVTVDFQRDRASLKLRHVHGYTTTLLSTPWTFTLPQPWDEPHGLSRMCRDLIVARRLAASPGAVDQVVENTLGLVVTLLAALLSHGEHNDLSALFATTVTASAMFFDLAVQVLVTNKLLNVAREVVLPTAADAQAPLTPQASMQRYVVDRASLEAQLAMCDTVIDAEFVASAKRAFDTWRSRARSELVYVETRGSDLAALCGGAVERAIKLEIALTENLTTVAERTAEMGAAGQHRRHKYNTTELFGLGIVPTGAGSSASDAQPAGRAWAGTGTPQQILGRLVQRRGGQEAEVDRALRVLTLLASSVEPLTAVEVQLRARTDGLGDVADELADLVATGLVVRMGFTATRLTPLALYEGFRIVGHAPALLPHPPRAWTNVATGQPREDALQVYLITVLAAVQSSTGTDFDTLYARLAGAVTRAELEDLLDMLVADRAVGVKTRYLLSARGDDGSGLLVDDPRSSVDACVRSYALTPLFFRHLSVQAVGR